MKIIGIDSSTKNCGVVVYTDGNLIEYFNYKYDGTYSVEKLRLIVADFKDLLEKEKPDAVLLEETVPVRNGRAVTSLNQVAGAIMAVAFVYQASVGVIPVPVIRSYMDIKSKEDSVIRAKEISPGFDGTDHESDAIMLVETYLKMQE